MVAVGAGRPSTARVSERIPLLGLTRAELGALVESWDISPAHAKRIWRHLYWDYADSLEAMADLPGKVSRPARRGAQLEPLAVSAAVAVERRLHPQAPAPPGRPPADRGRADALHRPGDGLRQQPGRLRHGMRVLRHRPDGLPAPLTAAEIVAQVVHVARALRAEHRGVRSEPRRACATSC